jgi:SAM-dependent methyltransferase
MDLSTIQHLTAINRLFYAEHAENFADARPRLPAGVARVLAGIAPGARVLELGCGDGKVGRALARAGVGAYYGLDSSNAMLERAIRYTRTKDEGRKTKQASSTKDTKGHEGEKATDPRTSTKYWRQTATDEPETFVLRPPSFVFLPADLASPSWSSVLPAAPFDWILVFAVLHHLPGYALRTEVLRSLAERLAPGGRVAVSNWQFTRSGRLQRRSVPWAQAGLGEDAVEPGDYLLSWERKGRRGLRYVHLIDHSELARAAAEAGLRVLESFSADGVTGDLSDYVVMGHVN